MRNTRLWIGLAAATAAGVLAASGFNFVGAQELPAAPPATRPADDAAAKADDAAAKPARKRPSRLIKPYSELDDLSPQQEAGIKSIHAQILDRKAELDRAERQQIMALLSDEQKDKVAAMEADADQKIKERSAAARQRAATRKSAGGQGDKPDDAGGDDASGM